MYIYVVHDPHSAKHRFVVAVELHLRMRVHTCNVWYKPTHTHATFNTNRRFLSCVCACVYAFVYACMHGRYPDVDSL